MQLDAFDVVILLVVMNITLSSIEFVLSKIKDKTKTEFDNKFHNFVTFLLEMVRWIMANKK